MAITSGSRSRWATRTNLSSAGSSSATALALLASRPASMMACLLWFRVAIGWLLVEKGSSEVGEIQTHTPAPQDLVSWLLTKKRAILLIVNKRTVITTSEQSCILVTGKVVTISTLGEDGSLTLHVGDDVISPWLYSVQDGCSSTIGRCWLWQCFALLELFCETLEFLFDFFVSPIVTTIIFVHHPLYCFTCFTCLNNYTLNVNKLWWDYITKMAGVKAKRSVFSKRQAAMHVKVYTQIFIGSAKIWVCFWQCNVATPCPTVELSHKLALVATMFKRVFSIRITINIFIPDTRRQWFARNFGAHLRQEASER